MAEDWDPTKICRDENCDREDVHRAHKRLRRKIIVHHRPSKSKRPLWRQDSREALRESVLNAVRDRPVVIHEITRDVRDDYGTVSDRSIYRYVKKLVKEASLVKLDLGLAFAAYIRPKSRLLSDPSALREYLIANADFMPTSTKESIA